ncbi:MAG: hypothetical protein K2N21_00370, partial [Rikenellaceae bacterium]|nr:hypothetical protein [Rikenellaceae bacterium]
AKAKPQATKPRPASRPARFPPHDTISPLSPPTKTIRRIRGDPQLKKLDPKANFHIKITNFTA